MIWILWSCFRFGISCGFVGFGFWHGMRFGVWVRDFLGGFVVVWCAMV